MMRKPKTVVLSLVSIFSISAILNLTCLDPNNTFTIDGTFTSFILLKLAIFKIEQSTPKTYETSVIKREEFMITTEEVLQSRVTTFRNYCATQTWWQNFTSNERTQALMTIMARSGGKHFSYHDLYKFVECRVPKTGTSERGRYMWPLFHHKPYRQETYRHPYGDRFVPKLPRIPISEVEERLKSYQTFLFVRDPMTRFVSGYLGKIRPNKTSWSNIIKRARAASNETNMEKPLSITAWAMFAAKMFEARGRIGNFHFDSYYLLCGECFVNFTFIGRTETLNRDFIHLATKVTNMSAEVYLPKVDWVTKSSTYMNLLRLIRRQDLETLIKAFRHEYAAFGYDEKDVWRFLDEKT